MKTPNNFKKSQENVPAEETQNQKARWTWKEWVITEDKEIIVPPTIATVSKIAEKLE